MSPISYFHKQEIIQKDENRKKGNILISKLIEFTYLFFTCLNVLLILRFVLVLLHANKVEVVTLIFNITNTFIYPFFGIFTTTSLFFGGLIEWDILIAIVSYTFICWVIVKLFEFMKIK